MCIKKIDIAIVLCLVLCIIFNLFSFAFTCNTLKNDVLRLHILANSDDRLDQFVKSKVRDAVLEEGAKLFDGANDLEQAKNLAAKHSRQLEKIADAVIQKYGQAYRAQVKLEKTYFETRRYDACTLPAGEYLALKVVLGEGRGHNWWCVLFPQLCFAASGDIRALDTLQDKEKELILSNPKWDVRFKCVEIYEKIMNKE